MSAPTRIQPALPRPVLPGRPRGAPPARHDGRTWPVVLAGCLALAAVSLAAPGEPTYDPLSWLIWGRELAHGTLSTITGPSWKPLPVVFTTPFSLLGDRAAPELWLVVARAGALLGVAMGYRLAARLAGRWAGAIAAVGIVTSEGYAFNAWRGNSEGLLVGLALWAVERHLDGHRRWAFVLGLACALLRPEVWPFWLLYGLWLAWRTPSARVLVAACLAAIPLAWFLPEYAGSGDLLRPAGRALQPNLDSPAYAAFPAWEVLRRSAGLLPLVVTVPALAALVAARRRAGVHDRVVLVLGGAAAGLLAAVALMTQAGFSGNLRYLELPVAFACVLAGAGWMELLRAARRRAGIAAAAVLAAAGLAGAAHAGTGLARTYDRQVQAAQREDRLVRDLPAIVAGAGGRARLTACGGLFTTRFMVPAVAWWMHLPLRDVDIYPNPPGRTLAPLGAALARDPRFPTAAVSEQWVSGRACHDH